MLSLCIGDIKLGDRVVVYAWGGCGKCGYCKNGDDDRCIARTRTL